ncbi:uncharacterized protein CCR75_005762 [Bremia lactucae]|uniref:Uncharacterized protein n=1 Tax=Bremia lactucae TaxID=4779 RepID=A0A976FG43_BRELC|nr:hypothetical protein CCR75_005762 [Bremia lactucae]
MLSDYRYEIQRVRGCDNIWIDLVSRWLPTSKRQPVTVKILVATEKRFRSSAPSSAEHGDAELIFVEGNVGIPTHAKELIAPMLVIAYCGLHLHRAVDVMMHQLRQKNSIKGMGELGNDFVATYLLCKHVKGNQLIQRPWSKHRKPRARNEVAF